MEAVIDLLAEWSMLLGAVWLGILALIAIFLELGRRLSRTIAARPPDRLTYGPGSWRRADEQADSNSGYVRHAPSQRPALPGSALRSQSPGNPERLAEFGLPNLHSTGDLLRWLDLDVRTLVLLANPGSHARPRKTNYGEWTVPKKRGGHRVICAPKPKLKAALRKIKGEILDRAPGHSAAHGFTRGRSIVTNGTEHIGRSLVINVDLQAFFEHVGYRRVVGVFRFLGYSSEVSRWLALLCTHQPALGVADPEGHRRSMLFCANRHAVQGAPTSPGVANLAARRLDHRLAGLARRFHATYTRYADDLTFSGDGPFKRGMKRFLKRLDAIIRAERFRINRRKTRFMRSSLRQEVTGVIVNEKLNVAREEYGRLKAILHNAQRTGLAAQNRKGRADFRAYLLGRIAHLRQIHPERANRLKAALEAL